MNIEARGVKGPVYMFETSTKNKNAIKLYQNADMPFAYSLATAVYTVMPNFTDFSSMLEIGKAGLNYAVLDNLYYYHTPNDNYNNINKGSLQHYGSQILPIVQEYTQNEKYGDMTYFESSEDCVFFNILPGVFVVYSDTFAIVIAVLGLILFGVTSYFMWQKGKIRIKPVLIALGIVFGAMLASAVFGFVMSYLVALIGGVPWKLTYVRVALSGIPFALSYMIILGLIIWLSIKKFGKDALSKYEYMLAGVFVSLLFGVITTFVLSGASFLFFWPAFIASASLLVNCFTDNYYANHALLSLNIIVALLFNVPLLYSLFLAITVGGQLALNLLFVMPLAILVPSVFIQKDLKLKIGEAQ